jgi:hypothetical protein
LMSLADMNELPYVRGARSAARMGWAGAISR